jgi:hypothetical protein
VPQPRSFISSTSILVSPLRHGTDVGFFAALENTICGGSFSFVWTFIYRCVCYSSWFAERGVPSGFLSGGRKKKKKKTGTVLHFIWLFHLRIRCLRTR